MSVHVPVPLDLVRDIAEELAAFVARLRPAWESLADRVGLALEEDAPEVTLGYYEAAMIVAALAYAGYGSESLTRKLEPVLTPRHN